VTVVTVKPRAGNGRRGADADEAHRIPVRGKLQRVKSQECDRHETRLGRWGEEESTERFKKPESAAKTGEVNPSFVASPDQSAEGKANLKRVSLVSRG